MADRLLKDATVEELEKEIRKRRNPPRPRVRDRFDLLVLAPLIKACQDWAKSNAEDDYVDEDHQHYIYEAAVEAIFGPEIWEWKEKVREGR